MIMRVAPGYFAAMGRTGIAGRDFLASDDALAPRVVMVNERFAADTWPGQPAVGRRLRLLDQDAPGAWRTVVGVTPDIMQGDATRQTFRPLIYVPVAQQPSSRAFVFLRSSRPVADAVRAIRDTAAALDADVTIEELSSVEATLAFDRDWMDLEHADLGKHAVIAPVFAGVALVLSALGLVAVVAHSVGQRTREIGVRMALGAAAHDIARMVLVEGMRPVVVGLVAGVALAAVSNRLLQSQLVGVSPYDPVTLMAGPLALLAAAAAGCRLPARRASRVDPMVALRHE